MVGGWEEMSFLHINTIINVEEMMELQNHYFAAINFDLVKSHQ